MQSNQPVPTEESILTWIDAVSERLYELDKKLTPISLPETGDCKDSSGMDSEAMWKIKKILETVVSITRRLQV